jgi:hypothetical protein
MFPENEFHFSWHGQRFGDFDVNLARDVNFARQAQHMRRLFLLRVLCESHA